MPTDPSTIQVRIHDLRQLFNSIDPSPFRERGRERPMSFYTTADRY